MHVTINGVTNSQPGVNVSYICGNSTVKLSVFRYYDALRNRLGGKGVIKPCDGDGLTFSTEAEAKRFCVERGYLRPFFKKSLPLM